MAKDWLRKSSRAKAIKNLLGMNSSNK